MGATDQLFVFSHGRMTRLGQPPATSSIIGASINDAGIIVATPTSGSNFCDLSKTPFVVNPAKGLAQIPLHAFVCTGVALIDDQNEVLGFHLTPKVAAEGFVNLRGGDFDRLGSPKLFEPVAIDKFTGHIAGDFNTFGHFGPALYVPALNELTPVPPFSSRFRAGIAYAINRRDQIVGQACISLLSAKAVTLLSTVRARAPSIFSPCQTYRAGSCSIEPLQLMTADKSLWWPRTSKA